MKKIFGTGLLLFLVFTVLAQDGKNPSRLEIGLGASIPIGTHSSGEINRHIKGFANTGQAVSISYYHRTKSKLGFLMMLSAQRNPLNTKALEEKYSNAPFYTFTPSSGPPLPMTPKYYDNWNFNKEAWHTFSLMFGGYTNIPFNAGSKFSFNAKAAIGVVYASSPEYKGIMQSDTAVIAIQQMDDHAIGFSYCLSPALHYSITPATQLTFNLTYFGTLNMNFKDVETAGTAMEQQPGQPGPNTTYSGWKFTSNLEQSIQTINICLGLSFRL
jgi:hypothetical protein